MYDSGPNGQPGPDGDRGLGKTALVVGGGLLAAASLSPLGKKFAPKLTSFLGKKPSKQHQQYQPEPQSHSYGYGQAASPQPPPGYYGQPQYTAGYANAGAGQTNIAPPSNVQQLHIYAAMFDDKDVTQIVRSLVTAQQSISLTGATLVKQFENPWPEAERHSFSVLYSYGDRPMECLVAKFVSLQPFSVVSMQSLSFFKLTRKFLLSTETGIIEIKPEALSKTRMDFCQPPPSRIIALVWGSADAST